MRDACTKGVICITAKVHYLNAKAGKYMDSLIHTAIKKAIFKVVEGLGAASLSGFFTFKKIRQRSLRISVFQRRGYYWKF